jgi:kynurenine formamidase
MARTAQLDAEREDALWREIAEQVPDQYIYNRGTGLFGNWYVGIGVASQVVEYLRERNVLILGFDGFNLDGTWTRPDMDAIAVCHDEVIGPFSEAVENAANFAVTVLEKLAGKPIFIEFVLQFEDDDPNAWIQPSYAGSVS